MKFVSIDIETTGLGKNCQVIQIGAVIEDTLNIKELHNLPKFNCIVQHDQYNCEPRANVMNVYTFEKLAELIEAKRDDKAHIRKKYNIIPVGLVAKSFALWLQSNGFKADPNILITVAGKNFGVFDKPHLEALPDWKSNIQVRSRIIDPSILCVKWKEDEALPSLQKCMERSSLTGQVTHDACQDALDVISVLRRQTCDYSIYTNLTYV